MASLQSPGVQVSVIDESFYTPAAPGTTPLIVVATAENKMNGSKTATAPGTLASNNGTVYTITSQRDLTDTFGVPFFELTATANPVHGGERNEYGLLAAYSLLGVTNKVLIIRADIDLDQLVSQTTAPGANPADGQWWLNTQESAWGILEWNSALPTVVGGQTFKPITPIVLTNDNAENIVNSMDYGRAPSDTVGSDGSYAVIAETGSDSKETIKYFFRRPAALGGGWHLLGSDAWRASWPTVSSSRAPTVAVSATGNLKISTDGGTSYTTLTLAGIARSAIVQSIADAINALVVTNGLRASVVNGKLYIYYNGQGQADSAFADSLVLEDGTRTWAEFGINLGNSYADTSATFFTPRLVQSPHTSVPAFKLTDANPRPTGSVWVKTTEPNFGSRWRVSRWSNTTMTWSPVNAPLYQNTHSANYYLDRANGGNAITVDNLFVEWDTDETYGGDLGKTVDHVQISGTNNSTGLSKGVYATFSAEQMTGGRNAAGTVAVDNTGAITAVEITDGGIGYTGTATVTLHKPANATTTGTGADTDFTIAVSSTSGIYVGMEVTGLNVGEAAMVTAINQNTKVVTVDTANDGAVSGSITFTDIGTIGTGVFTCVMTGDYFVQPATTKFKVWRRAVFGATKITSATRIVALPAGTATFTLSESQAGTAALNTVTITTPALTGIVGSITEDLGLIASAINNNSYNSISGIGLKNVVASVSNNTLTITHAAGGEIRVKDTDGLIASVFGAAYNPYTKDGLFGFYPTTWPIDENYDYLISNWTPLSASGFIASGTVPLSEAKDGTYWYNGSLDEVDLMVHDGSTWRGYREIFPDTDPAGPLIKALKPIDGDRSDKGALADNDIWISTADTENYPTMYRYQYAGTTSAQWVLIDVTDQTSELGILFADARYGLSGVTGNVAAHIAEYYGVTGCSYLDFDAPDPALYPKGMLMWNTRRSTGNVKRMHIAYVDKLADNARYNNGLDVHTYGGESQGLYDPEGINPNVFDRWVTASPNNEFGTGQFGRHAQRAIIVAKLKSIVDTNSDIRDEERNQFNLMACPGYPEVYSNLVNLNLDRGVTSFVVADTPLRLPADATSLTHWGTNAKLVTDNGDKGIVTYDEYSAVFYPNGYTTDLGGNYAVVPASHMILKTMILSDNVSYPWFAPAGTRRGGITNATAVGYLDPLTGEFKTVALNNGQRDTLYSLEINPIAFFVGVGLVNYGQKTRARNASALDRINVARLVIYLRTQLNRLARPYIFEPNDKITRDEIKQSVESFLLELVGLRALYDFAVVCDTSNNTPSRIDRNELWVDIAIAPVKAVEFIYIPLRLKNTGAV
jgi:hypothetical protein